MKLPDFCFKLFLLVLVLLGKHIEVILGNASGRPVLIHLSKQPVNLGFALLCLFQLRSLLFLRKGSFFVAGIEQLFQQLVLVFLCQYRPVLQSRKHIGIQHIIADIVHGALTQSLSVLAAMVVAVRVFILFVFPIG